MTLSKHNSAQKNTPGSLLQSLARARIAADPALAALSRRSGPTFRGAALRVQSERAPEWILAGSAETGKTFACLYRLDQLLGSTPNAQAALLRKLRTTIGGTVLVTYRRVIAMSGSGAVPWGGAHPEWYDYPNGARLWIAGMDDASKVLSSERDFIYVNQAEELSQDAWETLSTRATGRGAVTTTPMLFGDCNPGPADHWILRRKDAGALTLLESHHADNPSLYDATGAITMQGARSMAALNRLTGVRKLRLRDGLWVGAEGQFFETWDEDIHVCDSFAIPLDWPVWAALDYGFVHNTAFGVFTRHEGIVYQIGEHVQNKWTVGQHAGAMDALLERLGIAKRRLRPIVAGHDVFSNRGDSAGKTIADQYADYGYTLERAEIDRINGWAGLMERLGNPDAAMLPTFQAFRTCVRTIATIPTLVHDPRRPEDVLKTDADSDGNGGDDCGDMARYGLQVVQQQSTGALVFGVGKGGWGTRDGKR